MNQKRTERALTLGTGDMNHKCTERALTLGTGDMYQKLAPVDVHTVHDKRA